MTSETVYDSDGYIYLHTPTVECGKCGKEHKVPAKKITEKIRKIAAENGSRRE